MHLKKGDVVAIVATVVEEHSAKVEVTVNGAEIDGRLIVPGGVLRLLERAAAHGDHVVLADGRTGRYFQTLNEALVTVLLDDHDERDPAAYVNIHRDHIRNLDQDGVVQFAPIKKAVPGAETGREILESKPEAPAEIAEKVEEVHEVSGDEVSNEIVADIPSDVRGEIEEPPVTDEEQSQEGEVENPLVIEAEEDIDLSGEEVDEITVEMPDAPLPKREEGDVADHDTAQDSDASEEGTTTDNEEHVDVDVVEADTGEDVTSAEHKASTPASDAETSADEDASEERDRLEDGNRTEGPVVNEAASEEDIALASDAAAAESSDEPQEVAVEESAAIVSEEPKAPVDPARAAHLETMKKGILADIREQEGQGEEAKAEDETAGDIFDDIDGLDTKMS